MFPTSFHRSLAVLALLATPAIICAQSEDHSTPIELTHDKPYVMVTINGKGPFRFALDTGTGGDAIITLQLAEELGLPTDGYVNLSDPSGRGQLKVPRYVMDSVQVAGVEFTGVRAAEHPLSGVDGSCQGLLGFTLFRDYLLTLDYPGRRMTLETGALAPDGEQSVLGFRMPYGIPIIPMLIDGIAIEAQIDSGGTGLSVPEAMVARLRFASNPSLFGNEQSVSTRFQTLAAELIADVQLAGYTYTHPFIEINPAFPLANLGSSPLQKFVLTFDQKSGLVRFAASEKVLRLSPTPTPVDLRNAERTKLPDPRLVPVG
jgi:predicted aspartyl protease